MDYSTLALEYTRLSPEEKTQADRLIQEGKSEDFYHGMLEGLLRAAQLIKDPINRRQIAILSTRAAWLLKESFPSSIDEKTIL